MHMTPPSRKYEILDSEDLPAKYCMQVIFTRKPRFTLEVNNFPTLVSTQKVSY